MRLGYYFLFRVGLFVTLFRIRNWHIWGIFLVKVQFKISSVSPVVFTTWESFPHETKNTKRHIRASFLRYFDKILKINRLLWSKTNSQNQKHFFESINTLLEVLSTTAFLGIFPFTSKILTLINRHATNYSYDVIFVNLTITIEIIDLKN